MMRARAIRAWLLVAGVAAVLPLAACVRALVPPNTTPTPTFAPGAVQRDVTYCTAAGVALKLDLYFPHGAPLSAPVAVYVHGGGWSQGSKALGGWELQVAEALVGRGFLVASLDYRLAPQYTWPAQIEDVKCAIRYLRAHAAIYRLDPNRIGAWGGSAGGHLVSMLGLADASAGFDDAEQYTDQSSGVQAVVDLFGPADLTAGGWDASTSRTIQSVFGVAPGQASPVLARASPVTYVAPGDPPFLILQGDRDTTVPPSQSQELYDRLQAAGVPATLVLVRNAGHGFAPSGGPISPSLDQLKARLVAFLDRVVNAE